MKTEKSEKKKSSNDEWDKSKDIWQDDDVEVIWEEVFNTNDKMWKSSKKEDSDNESEDESINQREEMKKNAKERKVEPEEKVVELTPEEIAEITKREEEALEKSLPSIWS